MIAFQVSLLILTLCLTLLNLVLILGIARKVGRGAGVTPIPAGHLQLSSSPGTPIGEFVATSTQGVTVSRAALELGTVFAFLSPDCAPCQQAMPAFLSYATMNKGTVVSVLSGDYDGDVMATLEALGPVLVEVPNGPVARAFGVIGVPVFVTVGVGNVLATSSKIGPDSRITIPA
ncbi:hypothetical protein Aple_056970 [Acrocarpospora pleiomorpha]|uniref:Thioredoxin domain-containing protein n=1 Tax=Acrocarpospora pleiomorpha TaxID=90975 RepID=A0A5M3XWY5_9ACTN|nr:hypothetical protein [Acrocarpospora pleiomorpha]GES22798.1 hypothetical protein Aple_056970 [Acrocarpospora pleiomorpha]